MLFSPETNLVQLLQVSPEPRLVQHFHLTCALGTSTTTILLYFHSLACTNKIPQATLKILHTTLFKYSHK